MGFNYRKLFSGLNIVSKSVSANSQVGDLEVLNSDNQLYYYDGTINSPLATNSGTATIKNKFIDDTNTIEVFDTNFTLQSSADHSVTLNFDLTGAPASTHIVIPLGGTGGDIVFTGATQTLTNKSLVDNSTFIIDNLDNSKKVQFQASGVSTSTTRVLTVPNVDITLDGTTNPVTLQNKTLDTTNTVSLNDNQFLLNRSGNQAQFSTVGLTGNRTYTLPDASTTVVGTAVAQTLSNKTLDNSNSATLVDSSLVLQASADHSKQGHFSLAGLSVSANRVWSLPDASSTLVDLVSQQTLTSKTVNAALNSISNVTVGMMSSGAATNGQVATADGSGNVLWATGSGGSGSPKNFLINSNFDFWQRGTTIVTSGNELGPDRWRITTGNPIYTISQVAGTTPGAKYGAQYQITTSMSTSQATWVVQTLEPLSSVLLYNQTASVGIHVKALGNVNQVSLQFTYDTGPNQALTPLGSPVLASVNSSSFTYVQLNAQALGSLMAPNGTIGVLLSPTAVSSGNLYDLNNGFVLEQAMLNLGTSVGTYTRAGSDLGDEFVLCQRFYYRPSNGAFFANGYFDTTTSTIFLVEYPVPMWAVPFISNTVASDFVILRPGTSAANGTGSITYSNTDQRTSLVLIPTNAASTVGYGTMVTVGGSGSFEVEAFL